MELGKTKDDNSYCTNKSNFSKTVWSRHSKECYKINVPFCFPSTSKEKLTHAQYSPIFLPQVASTKSRRRRKVINRLRSSCWSLVMSSRNLCRGRCILDQLPGALNTFCWIEISWLPGPTYLTKSSFSAPISSWAFFALIQPAMAFFGLENQRFWGVSFLSHKWPLCSQML